MNDLNSLIKVLNRYNTLEKENGPLGGMAWDDIVFFGDKLIREHNWTKNQLEIKWPYLFKNQ